MAINLRDLATAEETYFTGTGKYTTASGGLAANGFTRSPGTGSEVLLAGVDPKKGYCLVGGVTATGPWIIWDNQIRGGFVHQEFRRASAAEAVCSDPRITSYNRIS